MHIREIMTANGYKLGVIAFIQAHLCCRQSGAGGSGFRAVVSLHPVWCPKPWCAQLQYVIKLQGARVWALQQVLMISRPDQGQPRCDQVPKIDLFGYTVQGTCNHQNLSSDSRKKPSNLWKRDMVAEGLRWWLAANIEIGMQALFLVLIKGFLWSAQLCITSSLGVRNGSCDTSHNNPLCPVPLPHKSERMTWTAMCLHPTFLLFLGFKNYSKSLKGKKNIYRSF